MGLQDLCRPCGIALADMEKEFTVGKAFTPHLDAMSRKQPFDLSTTPAAIQAHVENIVIQAG